MGWKWDELHNEWRPLRRYSLAAALFLLGLLARFLIAPLEGGLAFVTFYAPVLVAFYAGGKGPGVAVAVLSGLTADYLFLPPYRSFSATTGGYLSIGFFYLNVVLIGLVVSRLHARADEQRRSASELAESQRHLSMLLSVAPVGVFETDVNGKCTYVSERWSQITGVSADAARGDGWSNAIHPDDRGRVFAEWARASAAGQSFQAEYRFQRPDGKDCTVIGQSERLRSASGDVIGFVGTITDISERRQLERTLRLREFSLNHAELEVLWIDRNARIVDVNDPACRILGYSRAELLGLSVMDIDPVFPIGSWPEHWQELKAQGHLRFESMQKHRDGRTSPTEVVANYFEYEGQEYNCALVRDISERKQAEDLLRQSVDSFRMLFGTSIDAILLTAPDGQILSANPAACQMLQRSEEELCLGGRADIVDASDPRLAAALAQRSQTGRFAGELNFRRKDGSRFPGEVSTAVFHDSDGRARTSMIIRDISERKRLESALLESERRMSAVFQSSPIGIVISRAADGKILDVNDACLRLYRYTREEAMGRTVAELGAYVQPQQRVELLKLMREHGAVDGFLVDFRARDGKVGVLETSGRAIELGGEPCLLSMVTDVTERQRSQAVVRDQAFHDALTGLPNRRLLGNRLQQAMVTAKRSGCHGALMFLDLDNLKALNDSQGHDVGDLLLKEVAARLRSCVREMDTLARVGGDEFVVMLGELKSGLAESTAQASVVAEKIRSALSRPYLLLLQREGQENRQVEHLCAASIGVVLFADDAVGQDDMLNRADIAMYQAKRSGGNSIRFYDSRLKSSS